MGKDSATFKAGLERSYGFCQHDYLPPGRIIPERVIYSALPAIVLSSTVTESDLGQLIAVDGKRNTSVCADTVYVVGKIIAPERNIKIVARRIVFMGDDPAIVTDGIRGEGPVIVRAPAKPDRARNGENGDVIIESGFLIKNGQDGVAGGTEKDAAAADGAHGDSGTDAGDIEIVVEEWKGDCRLSAVGGDGHAGQDGQDGQDGGDGGNGDEKMQAQQPIDDVPGPPNLKPVIAGPGKGGRGGDAGRGGAGGAGGDAGQITVRWVKPLPPGVKMIATGGALGEPGKDGAVGQGGLSGKTVDSTLMQPVKLKLTCDGELRHGHTLRIQTLEKHVGDQNVLGRFWDKDWCYYWPIIDDRAQGWLVERVDGAGDGKVRYGDKVYLTNVKNGEKLVPSQDGYLVTSPKPSYWVLDPPRSNVAGVLKSGDELILRSQNGLVLKDAPGGWRYWYPELTRMAPPRTRAESGKLRDKRPGSDPWTSHKKGAQKAPVVSRIELSLPNCDLAGDPLLGDGYVRNAALAEQAADPTPPADYLCNHWHPAQAWLQVERLKGQYLTIELRGAELVDLAAELLRWQKLLTPLSKLPGAADAAQTELLGALGKMNLMRNSVSQGRDYFGNTRDYAPNPGFAFYEDGLAEQLKSFKVFQDHYDGILSHANEAEKLKQSATAAFREAVVRGDVAAAQLEDAKKALTAAQTKMVTAMDAVTSYKKALEPGSAHISAFQEEIKSTFNCSLEQILDGLAMMVFAPAIERGGHGSAPDTKESKYHLSGPGAVMAGVQLATFIKRGLETIRTSEGDELRKDQVLTTVRKLGSDLFASARDIFNDEKGRQYDVGGPGILATLDQWQDLVNQFASLKSAKDLEHDIRALASAVRARGDAVVDFNDKLSDVLGLADMVADNAEERTKSLAVAADLNSPGLPSLLSFLSRHHQERKDAAIELVYLANRAYAYWMLDDGTERVDIDIHAHGMNVFREVMVAKNAWDSADVYGAIDWAVLDACRATLGTWFVQNIASYSSFPTPFPAVEGSDGLRVVVRDPRVLADFKERRSYKRSRGVHVVKIQISSDGAAGTFTNEHLRGLADVRLTGFRVFLNGAFRREGHADQLIQIWFSHGGTDQNFTVKGERKSFTRPDLEPKSFIYDGRKDAARYVDGNRGKFTAGFIKMDGAIGSGGSPEELAHAGPRAIYAGVGPFAEWTILLDPKDNPGIDLDGLEEIEIQLVGVARTRNK